MLEGAVTTLPDWRARSDCYTVTTYYGIADFKAALKL